MTIGEKILNLRKARGWSQEELAEQIGVSRQAVSRWESDSAKPDADKIIAICDLFGVSADYLLRDISAMPLDTAPATIEDTKRSSMSGTQISGLVLICMSVFLVTLFSILGSIYGGTHHIIYGDGREKTYNGMMALVTRDNLEWLLWLLAGMAVVGIVLLLWKPVSALLFHYFENKTGGAVHDHR